LSDKKSGKFAEENALPSRSPPQTLLPWALSELGESGAGELRPVAGDASSRRYFRLALAESSVIVAESPPATEKNAAFVRRRALLADAGVRVPALLAADLERGYFLLEDLGDRPLLGELSADSAGTDYAPAFAILEQLALADLTDSGLDDYDEALLREELSRFDHWFVGELLGVSLSSDERLLLAGLYDRLVASALAQPRVLVHRDFHSRNLMRLADGGLAVIDFQDAVAGPVTYDLVSLLRDCYVRWPEVRVRAWALAFRARLAAAGLDALADDATFLRAFDWMGLQRHIKVLGTFARLYLRDGKRAYLADLPLVLDYTLDRLEHWSQEEPAFGEVLRWSRERLSPRFTAVDWGARR
jgi:aminoglycoside/choline kinase family phosphotransferase